MKLQNGTIKGVLEINPQVYEDRRGFFIESFKKEIARNFHSYEFIQDNTALSYENVLRGLHLQLGQTKLVTCVAGEIQDVVVDLRKDSETFGMHESRLLSQKNAKQLLVPPGVAHGYLVLSKYAIVQYKVDEYYNPSMERGVLWNDKDLKIKWARSAEKIILSDKDKKNLTTSNIKL